MTRSLLYRGVASMSAVALVFPAVCGYARVSASETVTIEEAAKRYRADADAAKQREDALGKTAAATAAFIATIRQRLTDTHQPETAGFTAYMADLEAQRVVEARAALLARDEAERLSRKAKAAEALVASLTPTAPVAPVPTFFGMGFESVQASPRDIAPARPPKRDDTPPKPDSQGAAPVEETNKAYANMLERVFAVLLDRPTNGAGGIQLSASDDGSRLSFKWAQPSLSRKRTTVGPPDNKMTVSVTPRLTNQTFGLSAKSDKAFADFKDGFRIAELTGDYGVTWTYFRKRQAPALRKSLEEAEAKVAKLCRAEKAADNQALSSPELAAECSGEKLRTWVMEPDDKFAFKHAAAQTELSKALWGDQLEHAFDTGFNVKAGWQGFTYRDLAHPVPATEDNLLGLTEEKPNFFTWQLSGFVGATIRKSGDAYVPRFYAAALAEAGREHDYPENTKDQVLCPPLVAGGAFVTCKKVNIGRPVGTSFYRAGGELHFKVPGLWLIPDLGFAPKLTYDFQDGQVAYEVPVLFAKDKDLGLSAGLTFKDEIGGDNPKKFMIGLFLGKAFKYGHW